MTEQEPTEQELRDQIEALGPSEATHEDQPLFGEMQKMLRNNERMRLRIALFDLRTRY